MEGTNHFLENEINPEGGRSDNENKKQQADLQKLVSERIAEEKTKWQKELKQEVKKAQADAAEYRALSKDEQSTFKLKVKEEELKLREKEIAYRELRAEAAEMLEQNTMPKELVDCIKLDDRAHFEQSVASLKEAFFNAVEKTVNERITDGVPKDVRPGSENRDPFLKGLSGK